MAGGTFGRLGHAEFMAFQGVNVTGYYPDLDLRLKLMRCTALRWPICSEIERTTDTLSEARRNEEDLVAVAANLNLGGRLVREEPPTLLLNSIWSERSLALNVSLCSQLGFG